MSLQEEPLIAATGGHPQQYTTAASPRRLRARRIIAALSLLTGIAVVAGLVLRIRAHVPRPGSIARIGQSLPALPVFDRSGRIWDAGKAGLGNRTIIVFFSPSCDVCRNELPKLRPFPSQLGLIMINEADGGSSEEIESLGLPYGAMFNDRDRVLERSSPMPGLPTILFVDERGILRSALVGEHDSDTVQSKLAEFARPHPGEE